MNKIINNAGFFRRLAAIIYDLLLLLGVLFVASAVAVAINHGQAVTHPLYYLSLLLITFGFFGWFWTHGGQTLGMQSWRIKLIANDNGIINWTTAGVRFIAAIFVLVPAGIGLLWILFDKKNRSLHDHLSKTDVIYLPKAKK